MDNMAKVAESLRQRIELAQEEGEDTSIPIFHQGRGNYSLQDLEREVSQGTDFGKGFVAQLENAASEDNTSLEEFLLLGMPE